METANAKNGLNLRGEIGDLAQNVIDNWLIGLRETNPAILDMFHDREKEPDRGLLPWSGEFAGKYITGAYYVYKLTGSKKLYDYIMTFIDELISCIDEDGYAGCYSRQYRLTGKMPKNVNAHDITWDSWSHYHIMYGLYVWYLQTGGQYLLDAVLRIAEKFFNTFYGGQRRIIDMGSSEMNLAVLHIFTLLYGKTRDGRYLTFIREMEKDISDPDAGNYVEHAQNGLEYYQCPKPRWESLHVIMGINKMSDCLGDSKYSAAAKQIFYSILKTDIHNNGGFSTDEAAIGHPFKNGAIELCCVIAYNALACDILKDTGDITIADFLEISLYNAILGSFSPTGRWSVYNTPMEGTKKANYQDIVFQSRPGSPELNCCSVNAARGIGQLSDWAVMQENGTVYINCFESMNAEFEDISVEISGDYPASPKVELVLTSNKARTIAVRIPAWSKKTTVSLDGKTETVAGGRYFAVNKKWAGEKITITFDFTPHFQEGGGDYAGMRSVFAGPVLYGYDLSLNDGFDFSKLPPVRDEDLSGVKPEKGQKGRIILKLKNGMTLCDFYHLGMTGCQYKTWFARRYEV